VLAPIARAIGSDNAAKGLYHVIAQLGAKISLRELGMPETEIEKAAILATQNPYWNPRPLELQSIRELIQRAWKGETPRP
jgi:maleylacetate reductase